MGKIKGGRRKSLAKRHPCNKIVQLRPAERERETREVAYRARQRVFGLSVEQSTQQQAGCALGRLWIGNDISREQLEAAGLYEEIQRDFARAIVAARPVGSASDYDRTGGYDGDEGDDPDYIERCNRARRRMAESRRALLEADPFAQMAVDAWVLEDKAMWDFVGELRAGLNALVRLYGIEAWRKEKTG